MEFTTHDEIDCLQQSLEKTPKTVEQKYYNRKIQSKLTKLKDNKIIYIEARNQDDAIVKIKEYIKDKRNVSAKLLYRLQNSDRYKVEIENI